jgi:hypothetical protein
MIRVVLLQALLKLVHVRCALLAPVWCYRLLVLVLALALTPSKLLFDYCAA